MPTVCTNSPVYLHKLGIWRSLPCWRLAFVTLLASGVRYLAGVWRSLPCWRLAFVTLPVFGAHPALYRLFFRFQILGTISTGFRPATKWTTRSARWNHVTWTMGTKNSIRTKRPCGRKKSGCERLVTLRNSYRRNRDISGISKISSDGFSRRQVTPCSQTQYIPEEGRCFLYGTPRNIWLN